ncbi:MAG: hypothetical protein MUC36_26620 [Planctomycetes bacterium]|nr:hypothetical protein [Planctomycetota bacterium]
MNLRSLLPFVATLLPAAAALAQDFPLTPIAVPNGKPGGTAEAAFYGGPAWQQFLAAAGGAWRVDWSAATGTPRAIYGSGLPLAGWGENSLTEQYFRGLPVIGGRADVRINMIGKVSMLGSQAWPIAADFAIVPALDADAAVAIAWAHLGAEPTGVEQPGAPVAPRLVLWGDLQAAQPTAPVLAYEVLVSNLAADGSGPIVRYYIDARTGAVVHTANGKHECGVGCGHERAAAAPASSPASLPPIPTTITVRGWTRTSVDAVAAPTNVPLPGVQVQVPGHGVFTTNAAGQFSVDLTGPVSITVSSLDGRHHRPIVDDSGSLLGGFAVVLPGLPATVQLLTGLSSPAAIANTTATFWLDAVNEFARSIYGDTRQIAFLDEVGVRVNTALTCNAFYTQNSLNFYAAGGPCQNMAQASVIAHEWGHALDEQYGGLLGDGGLMEGWADLVAMFLTDTPVIGLNIGGAGTFLRTGDNTLQFPAGSGVHERGQSWMGFGWKLRGRLEARLGSRAAANALTNDIVLGAIVANPTTQGAALLEVFLADDNDADLNNGTPHAPELIWAAEQHSLPLPSPASPANNECSYAFQLTQGLNGPFTNVGATTSAPAWGCGNGANDVWFRYAASAAGQLSVSTCGQAAFDTVIQVFQGSCGNLVPVACNDDACSVQSTVAVNVTPGLYLIRVGGYLGATGPFQLQVSGPGSQNANIAAYGAGCGAQSRSFYDWMPNGTFDLANRAFRMVRNGNRYTVQNGGSYLTPPPNASTLPLVNDSLGQITINPGFPYVGGVATTLFICDNGWVTTDLGSSSTEPVRPQPWLDSQFPRWGCWHDFDPTAAGSGLVKVHFVGALLCVTWDGVASRGLAGTSTFQLQLDVGTGNVTYVFGSMATAGRVHLVGYAAGGSSGDLGNRDLLTTLTTGSGSFRTDASDNEALRLRSTAPRIGTTATLTTEQIPLQSGLAGHVLGLGSLPAGAPLPPGLGLPGCVLYATPDLINVAFPVLQQAPYALTVPATASLVGSQLFAQGLAFVPSGSGFLVSTSNGLALTVGW